MLVWVCHLPDEDGFEDMCEDGVCVPFLGGDFLLETENLSAFEDKEIEILVVACKHSMEK